ncbi:MAG: hypothetical protein GY787_18565 [Alteromonadales bacterium]|nr:hypothetical protein [Alteromonadales bacterium]
MSDYNITIKLNKALLDVHLGESGRVTDDVLFTKLQNRTVNGQPLTKDSIIDDSLAFDTKNKGKTFADSFYIVEDKVNDVHYCLVGRNELSLLDGKPTGNPKTLTDEEHDAWIVYFGNTNFFGYEDVMELTKPTENI